jgi:prepilin peptidase CpaA
MPVIEPINLLQYALYGWLALALIVASITDVIQRRIPNLVTYPTVFIALIAYSYIGGWEGLFFSIGGCSFGFAVFFMAYLMGGMGAGDIKLMSAVGAVLGFKQTVITSLIIAICGGILAIGFAFYHRNLKNTLSKIFLSILYLGMYKDSSLLKVDQDKISRERIPYGVAITSGVFLFYIFLIMENKALPVFRVT